MIYVRLLKYKVCNFVNFIGLNVLAKFAWILFREQDTYVQIPKIEIFHIPRIIQTS